MGTIYTSDTTISVNTNSMFTGAARGAPGDYVPTGRGSGQGGPGGGGEFAVYGQFTQSGRVRIIVGGAGAASQIIWVSTNTVMSQGSAGGSNSGATGGNGGGTTGLTSSTAFFTLTKDVSSNGGTGGNGFNTGQGLAGGGGGGPGVIMAGVPMVAGNGGNAAALTPGTGGKSRTDDFFGNATGGVGSNSSGAISATAGNGYGQGRGGGVPSGQFTKTGAVYINLTASSPPPPPPLAAGPGSFSITGDAVTVAMTVSAANATLIIVDFAASFNISGPVRDPIDGYVWMQPQVGGTVSLLPQVGGEITLVSQVGGIVSFTSQVGGTITLTPQIGGTIAIEPT